MIEDNNIDKAYEVGRKVERIKIIELIVAKLGLGTHSDWILKELIKEIEND